MKRRIAVISALAVLLLCGTVGAWMNSMVVGQGVSAAPASNYAVNFLENQRIYTTFTANDIVDVYFMFNTANDFNTREVANIANGTTGLVYCEWVTSTRKLQIKNTSGGSAISPTDAMTVGTTYHVKIHYEKGTGGNSVYSIEYNTSGTFSGDGNDYVGASDGAATLQANRGTIGPSSALGTDPTGVRYDVYRVDTAIGSGGACTGACLVSEEFDGASACYSGDATYNNCDVTWNLNPGTPNFQGTDLE